MEKLRLGLAMTGSFCTFDEVLKQFETFRGKYELYPIMSTISAFTDTRFGTCAEFRKRLEDICGREIIDTIPKAEPIGPKKLLDCILIAPCTGNTLAKLAVGIADTPVTLAVKAHLRNNRPVVVAVSTNDGLGANGKNIGALMARGNFFFVPFGQDSPEGKPTSLVAKFDFCEEAVKLAMEGKQLQPMLR